MKGGLPLTFPPELRVLPGVQVHMRALAYGVWAGIVLNTGSTLAPNYDRQASKGYMRARQERRQGTGMPPGRMGVTRPSPYSRGGKSGGGRPERWLLHITVVGQLQDTTATTLRPGAG